MVLVEHTMHGFAFVHSVYLSTDGSFIMEKRLGQCFDQSLVSGVLKVHTAAAAVLLCATAPQRNLVDTTVVLVTLLVIMC